MEMKWIRAFPEISLVQKWTLHIFSRKFKFSSAMSLFDADESYAALTSAVIKKWILFNLVSIDLLNLLANA